MQCPSYFPTSHDKIFEKERWNYVIPYLDDIIVFSKTKEEHDEHLKIVLGRIKSAGLSLNPGKCKFYKNEIKILGNIIAE